MWPCDQTPSILYINQGNGKFVDEALIRGAALDDNGKAMSGMGVAAADYLHEGIPSIFRTNFSDELETLYRNRGKGEFQDVSVEAGLGRNTRFVGWGCGFFDFDNDGWPDLLLVNGHAFPEVDRLKIDIHYRERAILYRNDHGKFVDISESAGPGIHGKAFLARAGVCGLRQRWLGGSPGEQSERAAVALDGWRNKPSNHWIELKLEGVKSNRSAIGARVRVTAGGFVQTAEVRSGGSYLSQSDLRLHFGLGSAAKVDRDRDRVAGRWNADRRLLSPPIELSLSANANPSIHHTSRCWRAPGRTVPQPAGSPGERRRPACKADPARYTWRAPVSRHRQTVAANHGLPKKVASPCSNGEYSISKTCGLFAVTA